MRLPNPSDHQATVKHYLQQHQALACRSRASAAVKLSRITNTPRVATLYTCQQPSCLGSCTAAKALQCAKPVNHGLPTNAIPSADFALSVCPLAGAALPPSLLGQGGVAQQLTPPGKPPQQELANSPPVHQPPRLPHSTSQSHKLENTFFFLLATTKND